MNEIRSIIGKQVSHQARLRIKQLGPPRPDLSINRTYHTKNRSYNRQFNRNLYDKCDWLCGCSEKHSFFCFPCTLFGSHDVWATTGVNDLKHLDEKIKKHSVCKQHLQNEINTAMLGNVDIRLQLNDAYRLSIKKQHEQVDKNRYILSRLIDCIKFCGTHELALRGHDEHKVSDNPGIFQGLVEFVASLDVAVNDHLNSSRLSKTIQNEILDAILEVTRAHIKNEIDNTSYLSIQVDETTDISCMTQIGLIFRYQIEGQIFERFWGFFKIQDRTADGISLCVLNELSNVGVDKVTCKLIGQTYDGARVMSDSNGGVQIKVKEIYPAANFIHCYAHQGNLIMQQATSSSKPVRIFFSDIEGIAPFFRQSPKRTDTLTEVVKRTMPQSAPTTWNFESRIVNTVYEHKNNLVECFEIIRDTFDDRKTISLASGFIRLLEDSVFLFWLEFFHKVMPHVDIFFNEIQKKIIDATQVHTFTTAITEIRENLCESTLLNEETPDKRKCLQTDNKVHALEVCDIIVNQAKNRFAFTAHLSAARLFLPEHFKKYNKLFPVKEFEITISAFKELQKCKLKTELEVLYSRDDLRVVSGAVSLLQFLIKNNLKSIFSETVKLLQIIVTIPMTTVESERCFSTLSRVKTFLRSTMGQERLNSLAVLSIERQLINSIPDFNQKVIDVFSQSKNRRMEFNYKSCIKIVEPDTVQEINDETKRTGIADNNFDPKKELHKRKPEEHLELSLPKRPRVQTKKQEDPKNLDPAEKKKRRDDCRIFGEHVANKLSTYDSRIRAIVQHQINNILFEADMGRYSHSLPEQWSASPASSPSPQEEEAALASSPAPPGGQETSSDLPPSSSSQPYLEVVKEEEGVTEQHMPHSESLEEEMTPEVGSPHRSTSQHLDINTELHGIDNSICNESCNKAVESHLQTICDAVGKLTGNRPSLQKEDEFDVFGRSVAIQLRTLPFAIALETQLKLQSILTEMRLKTNYCDSESIRNGIPIIVAPT